MSTRLSYIKVGQFNLDQVMALSVRDSEKHLIASNAEWLADAAHEPDALSFAIHAGPQAVGLISVIDPRVIEDAEEDFQPQHLYVWRLMIDQAHRGYGYGAAAIAFAAELARIMGLKGVSLTTMDRAAGNALPFYNSLGFQPTGRRLNGEVELLRDGVIAGDKTRA